MSAQTIGFIVGILVMLIPIAIPFFLVRFLYRDDNVTEADTVKTGCFFSLGMYFLLRILMVAYIAAFFPLSMVISDWVTLANSANWQSTEGSIRYADIVEGSIGSIPYYTVQLTYDYTEIQNERPEQALDLQRGAILIRDFPYLSADEAQAVLDKYPVGSSVTVYYDPDSYPVSHQVLERQLSPMTNWLIGGSVLLLLLGGLSFFVYLKPLRIARILNAKNLDPNALVVRG